MNIRLKQIKRLSFSYNEFSEPPLEYKRPRNDHWSGSWHHKKATGAPLRRVLEFSLGKYDWTENKIKASDHVLNIALSLPWDDSSFHWPFLSEKNFQSLYQNEIYVLLECLHIQEGMALHQLVLLSHQLIITHRPLGNNLIPRVTNLVLRWR